MPGAEPAAEETLRGVVERRARTVEKYRKTDPKRADWTERALPENLTVFDLARRR